MAQQSSGEFASANPTKREENARVQERGIRAKISLNPRSHLQHLQRPTPSDISKNAPSLQGLSHAGVARSRRRRMISAVKPDEPASDFQQRDNAPACSAGRDKSIRVCRRSLEGSRAPAGTDHASLACEAVRSRRFWWRRCSLLKGILRKSGRFPKLSPPERSCPILSLIQAPGRRDRHGRQP